MSSSRVGHRGEHVGQLRQLGPLLGLPLGDDPVVGEALRHLAQHALDRAAVVEPERRRVDQRLRDRRRRGRRRDRPRAALPSRRYAGSTLFSTSAPRCSLRSASSSHEELGLVERAPPRAWSRRRTWCDGRRAAAATALGPLDEAVVHRLEEDEELGDVLQELRAEDAVGHRVEGLRRHADHDATGTGTVSQRSSRLEKKSAMRSGASRKSRAFRVGGVSTTIRS